MQFTNVFLHWKNMCSSHECIFPQQLLRPFSGFCILFSLCWDDSSARYPSYSFLSRRSLLRCCLSQRLSLIVPYPITTPALLLYTHRSPLSCFTFLHDTYLPYDEFCLSSSTRIHIIKSRNFHVARAWNPAFCRLLINISCMNNYMSSI